MIALLVTTWILVILRFYARFMVSKASGVNDWLFVVVLVGGYSKLILVVPRVPRIRHRRV
ncbi:hypothetical protein V8E51_003885 [Hyaloscypha variabilis]